MKLFSFACAVIVGSLAVLSSSPVGWASAEELRVSGESSATRSEHASSVVYHVGQGISLGTHHLIGLSEATRFKERYDTDGRASGYEFTYDDGFGVQETLISATVEWPILSGEERKETGYTARVQTEWLTRGSAAKVNYAVFGPDGSETSGPFHCSLVKRWGAWDWDMYITDHRVGRVAEASGSITTDGSVKLDGSVFAPAKAYATESRLRVDGATFVPVSSSTQFDAVLSPSDVTPPRKPKEPKTARMKFQYAIRDAGESDSSIPKYYVHGDVSNEREDLLYQGDSSCEIVDHWGDPVQNSGYSCTMNGYHAQSGRAHYITDFTISKK
jgi:hypothetical protein